MALKSIRKRVNRHLAEFETSRKICRKESEALEQVEQDILDATEAQSIAQQVAQRIQQEAHDQIAGVVSRCLKAVFDEPYTFHINFERKRGRTEADLYFEREGQRIDPMTASGGGVVDIASFALRLACLSLSRPQLRRLVVLDEPFKFLSEEYQDRAATLIMALAKDMGVQFLIVTHDDAYKMGTVQEF